MKNLGLYIHVPFCVSKCGYCDFYSVTSGAQKKQRYLDALDEYLESYAMQAKDHTVDTVYIGGGTPTSLPVKSLCALVKKIYKLFGVSKKTCEFTVEANPGTYGYRELKAIRRAGVNRLSIGAQSIHDNELTSLTRIYKASQLRDFLLAAKKARFSNISVDIMYGIPHQTKESLCKTIDTLVSFGIQHVSLYGLMIEEGTPFYRDLDIIKLPDEDCEREMYFTACELLEKHGYMQYEISNFAKSGFQCRHNLKYWNCDEYLGIGPAAHSYFANKRFSFKRSIDIFTGEKDAPDGTALQDYMEIPQKDRIGEYVMLRLRLTGGINLEKFYARFGVDFESLYFDKLAPFLYTGHVIKDDHGNIRFSREGMYVSNYILSRILDFEVTDGSAKSLSSICLNG